MISEHIRMALSLTDYPTSSEKCHIVDDGQQLENCVLYKHIDFISRAIRLK